MEVEDDDVLDLLDDGEKKLESDIIGSDRKDVNIGVSKKLSDNIHVHVDSNNDSIKSGDNTETKDSDNKHIQNQVLSEKTENEMSITENKQNTDEADSLEPGEVMDTDKDKENRQRRRSADKKLPGAEKRSKYYVKYGNPNFGGAVGLLSNSRKRKFRARQMRDEIKEAKEAIKSQQRSTITYDDVDIFGDDSLNVKLPVETEFGASIQTKKKTVEDRLGKLHEPESPVNSKTDNDLEEGEIIESEAEENQLMEENDDLDLTLEDKPKIEEIDEEAAMMEEELDILLASPPKKRSMRMYADDIEDEIIHKKIKKDDTTTVTSSDKINRHSKSSSQRNVRSRVRDARQLITGRVGKINRDSSPEFEDNRGGDLRSRLGKRKGGFHDQYSGIKIAVDW
ncbi:hypothetical protein KUTeg_009337 [Tegillarca granosa]|uniref:Nuclear cap-binding protein subunit 3 n=1 Tax=Tegillarca granosa TaxID=220873 RepID=A0ABQ9F3I6_TEGGR|nr:hypothetical protein KUTeg_009337 [Tegillarca granosa]